MKLQTNKEELFPLTSLRFFLALWVVIFHQTVDQTLSPSFLPQLPSAIYSILRTGYAAVGVFFMLSGFVLSLNYPLGERWSGKSFLSFAVARLSRIYPVYLLGLILVSPVVLGPQLFPLSLPGLTRKLLSGLLNLFLLQAWRPQSALSWNGPGWSLSNELFFYACFPFIGILLWQIRDIRKCFGALALLWVLALAAPAVAILVRLPGYGDISAISAPKGVWALAISHNPVCQFPLFCSGIPLGRLFVLIKESRNRLLGRGQCLYLPGLGIAVLVLACAEHIPYPLLHNGLLQPAYCAVILGFALNGGILARLLSRPLIVFLGKASYSQYILQFPVWLLFAFLTRQRFMGFQGATLQIALLLLLSAIVYRFVEEPSQQALRRAARPWVDRFASALLYSQRPDKDVLKPAACAGAAEPS